MENILTVFIPTIFVISITPSICMILALNVGIKVGVLRSLWMIVGELLGLSLVFLACALSSSSLSATYPKLFFLLKYLGGGYIIWLGIQGIKSKGKIKKKTIKKKTYLWLGIQGFLASFLHPKAWIFFAVFVPSFINLNQTILPQVLFLLWIILTIEFCNLLLYAISGNYLTKIIRAPQKIQWIHRFSGFFMVLVGGWLILW